MNAAFLSMAIHAGMTSAIMNPLHTEEMGAVLGADVMMGHDPECRRWIKRFREQPAEGEAVGARSSRARRRRRA
jgi:5-methyltetrahydrofolate--homocysteine methyltransferase